MKLLTPLGLLGLLGIIALIIIYIIKPNFQQKFISSTFVWKLSLKYRKKRLPISKLRNILIIICQILILTACALILAEPVQILKEEVEEKEVIAIIDASASMRTQMEGETRYERAVNGVVELAGDTLLEDGIVSVILANNEASFLGQRVRLDGKDALTESLNGLIEENTACTYGTSDVDGALLLCEDVLKENPDAKIYLYTDTNYAYVPDDIEVVRVSESEEWNAGILDAYAELDQNYYSFVVDVACYGRDQEVDLTLEVYGANSVDSDAEESRTLTFTETVYCSLNETKRVIFISASLYQEAENVPENYIYVLIDDVDRVYSYRSVHISLAVEDSFHDDDNFDIYGGQKEALKIQYASSWANDFINAALITFQGIYDDRWDMQITEVKRGEEGALEGFDFYIFEHSMPAELPTDGVVLLINPDKAISGAGIDSISETPKGDPIVLTQEAEHPLLKNMYVDNVTVTKYVEAAYEAVYQPLASVDGTPVLLLKDEPTSKVLVMGFSLHYSNFSMVKEFPLFIYNIFEYFFPTTVEGNAFEVNQKVQLNARGNELQVSKDGVDVVKYDAFPATMMASLPGTYELVQTTFTGETVTERIYVKIPASESNIWEQGEALESPQRDKSKNSFYKDLLLFIAIALVTLLFAERLLQLRDNA